MRKAAVAAIVFAFATSAMAARNDDAPRDPISRIMNVIRRLIVMPFDDGLTPPKPGPGGNG
jgi:hypothetical protein